ncbi:microtubule-associated protein futsch-like [Panonychus citri]|uniref:microtubule-associated protein futsch-like n=1 Tax=Panonychus citri TaxID=50023 RepID=UPI0023081084|nr:microtubule-associated protein futsch-like [Panonychus citri]
MSSISVSSMETVEQPESLVQEAIPIGSQLVESIIEKRPNQAIGIENVDTGNLEIPLTIDRPNVEVARVEIPTSIAIEGSLDSFIESGPIESKSVQAKSTSVKPKRSIKPKHPIQVTQGDSFERELDLPTTMVSETITSSMEITTRVAFSVSSSQPIEEITTSVQEKTTSDSAKSTLIPDKSSVIVDQVQPVDQVEILQLTSPTVRTTISVLSDQSHLPMTVSMETPVDSESQLDLPVIEKGKSDISITTLDAIQGSQQTIGDKEGEIETPQPSTASATTKTIDTNKVTVSIENKETLEKEGQFEVPKPRREKLTKKTSITKQRSISIERPVIMEMETPTEIQPEIRVTPKDTVVESPSTYSTTISQQSTYEAETIFDGVEVKPRIADQSIESIGQAISVVTSDVSQDEVPLETPQETLQSASIELPIMIVAECRVDQLVEKETETLIDESISKPKTKKIKAKPPIKSKQSLVVVQRDSFEKEGSLELVKDDFASSKVDITSTQVIATIESEQLLESTTNTETPMIKTESVYPRLSDELNKTLTIETTETVETGEEVVPLLKPMAQSQIAFAVSQGIIITAQVTGESETVLESKVMPEAKKLKSKSTSKKQRSVSVERPVTMESVDDLPVSETTKDQASKSIPSETPLAISTTDTMEGTVALDIEIPAEKTIVTSISDSLHHSYQVSTSTADIAADDLSQSTPITSKAAIGLTESQAASGMFSTSIESEKDLDLEVIPEVVKPTKSLTKKKSRSISIERKQSYEKEETLDVIPSKEETVQFEITSETQAITVGIDVPVEVEDKLVEDVKPKVKKIKPKKSLPKTRSASIERPETLDKEEQLEIDSPKAASATQSMIPQKIVQSQTISTLEAENLQPEEVPLVQKTAKITTESKPLSRAQSTEQLKMIGGPFEKELKVDEETETGLIPDSVDSQRPRVSMTETQAISVTTSITNESELQLPSDKVPEKKTIKKRVSFKEQKSLSIEKPTSLESTSDLEIMKTDETQAGVNLSVVESVSGTIDIPIESEKVLDDVKLDKKKLKPKETLSRIKSTSVERPEVMDSELQFVVETPKPVTATSSIVSEKQIESQTISTQLEREMITQDQTPIEITARVTTEATLLEKEVKSTQQSTLIADDQPYQPSIDQQFEISSKGQKPIRKEIIQTFKKVGDKITSIQVESTQYEDSIVDITIESDDKQPIEIESKQRSLIVEEMTTEIGGPSSPSSSSPTQSKVNQDSISIELPDEEEKEITIKPESNESIEIVPEMEIDIESKGREKEKKEKEKDSKKKKVTKKKPQFSERFEVDRNTDDLQIEEGKLPDRNEELVDLIVDELEDSLVSVPEVIPELMEMIKDELMSDLITDNEDQPMDDKVTTTTDETTSEPAKVKVYKAKLRIPGTRVIYKVPIPRAKSPRIETFESTEIPGYQWSSLIFLVSVSYSVCVLEEVVDLVVTMKRMRFNYLLDKQHWIWIKDLRIKELIVKVI